jgi:hypothetical protein
MVQAKVWTLEELHSLPDDGIITVVRPGEALFTTTDRLTWAPNEISATLEINLVDVFGPEEL